MPRKLLIVDVAALSPREIGDATPNLRALATRGGVYPLREPFPSLTCPSHATLVMGSLPEHHGMVGNCLYSREYAKLFNWNRSSHLLSGTPLWEAARARDPNVRTANLFLRHCADSTCEIRVTERPVYWISGRKQFEFFAEPRALHGELIERLGPFPFPRFWGPLSGIQSSEWIIGAALHVLEHSDPELLLVYPPFLDYDAARFGPEAPQVSAALSAMDAALAPLLRAASTSDRDVLIVSDYGFTTVDQPVFLNRVLRRAGLLNVEAAENGERLDPGTSRAFAVCDNQVAHVYVARAEDIANVRALLEATPGVAEVLDVAAQARLGIAHPRSGELIATATPRAWFAYPYWLEADKTPDFHDCVAVFDKIGTDTCELFLKPGVAGKLHLAKRMAQLAMQLKVPFDIVDTDERNVRGARRIARDDPQRGAAVISSWDLGQTGPVPMESLKDLALSRMFD
ncbi:MAG TPA: alkaline phosphatase family protein [Polyangiales bacterium]|nr:alkaline phosphatase family protein [Polyangiales bacterium]